MELREFDELVGGDSYVRCSGKKRQDSAIVSASAAEKHLKKGGSIGWWVKSGYIIVDIDEGKEKALKAIKQLGIKTLMCKTPKGVHLYFKTNKEFPQRVGMVTPFGLKCDFRCANKGYVVLPFNMEDRVFNKRKDVAELPMELTPLIGRKESLLGLKEGDGRNAALFAHLMAYKNRGASYEQIQTMAEVINDVIFDDPMSEEELNKIVSNTENYQAALEGDNPYLIYNVKGVPTRVNDRAIVDYFVNRGDMFVLGGDCYLYYEGVYRESNSRVRNMIKDMIQVDNFISQNTIMNVFKLLTDDTRLQKSALDLNSDTNLINFKNGVWNIKQKRLLPHDPGYMFTIQIPHSVGEYVPFKETLMYDFMKKTQLPKEDIKMILSYMAYCMTLSYGLKTFMVLVGQSNTGKSVLIRFFEHLIGKANTSSLSMHELNMRFYPSQLYSKLLNSCADNSSLPLSSIENLKKITGGDQIMHEKKGRDPFFFVPFCKLIFSFNQLPLQLEEKSNAFYKRMRILFMNNELFLNDEYVNRLCSDESIEQLIPYLLKLMPIEEIPRTAMSNKYVEALREDSDSIHAFLKNECTSGPTDVVTKTALYDAYAQFCVYNGREAHKKHAFMRSMRAQGFEEIRDKASREACWKGVSLKKK